MNMNKLKKEPPQWPVRLIERLCDPTMVEVLYGDVQEVYFRRLTRMNRILATILYYRDAFSLLRPFALRRTHQVHPRLNFIHMLFIQLKAGLRTLKKHPMPSTINIFGLLSGMLIVLLIAHYAHFELSYDRFHRDYNRIYRLAYQRQSNNEVIFNGATTYLPVGPSLKREVAGVSEQTRLYYPFTHGSINYDNESFIEEKPVFADPSFFQVFGFELIKGAASQVLQGPNRVVLSQTLADRYFGKANPIGKTIEFSYEDGETLLTVSGVMANPREDSHLRLHMLISFSTLDQWTTFEESKWFLPFYHTYIKTNTDFDEAVLESKANELITKNAFKRSPNSVKEFISLQPLQDIHLDSDLMFEMHQNGDRKAVYFLIAVAVIILLIAYLNYINMSTALAVQRAREVGVRKVMGSTKGQLVQQFLTESFLLNMAAFIMAGLLTTVLTPFASRLMSKNFDFIDDPLFWLTGVLVATLGAALAGIYPALILSGYRPVDVLKGRFSSGSRGGLLRKLLVTVQFVISIVMIGGTLLLFKQTNFLINKDPGFDAAQVLVINAPRNVDPSDYELKVRSFANEVVAISGVNSFSHSGSVPGKVMGSGTFKRLGQAEADEVTLQMNSVDYDFFRTYGLKFLQGRPFDRALTTDRQTLILNEAAMNMLGFKDPKDALKSKLVAFEQEFNILGVIENYHHSSPKVQYEPIAFVYNPGRTIYFSINMRPQNLLNTLAAIETSLTRHFPKSPFDYFFLEEAFHRQFEADLRFVDMFKVFTLLAVLLGTLGLFALASFVVNQKIKEIGVRQVLGASTANVFKVFVETFQWPMWLGATIALALLYFGANRWLRDFPYRIALDITILLVPLILIVSLTLIIVAYQTFSVVRSNPIKSLRQE